MTSDRGARRKRHTLFPPNTEPPLSACNSRDCQRRGEGACQRGSCRRFPSKGIQGPSQPSRDHSAFPPGLPQPCAPRA